MIHANRPKEGKAWRKIVNVQSRLHPRAQVLPAIGQGVSQFQVGGGARFLHVVPTDGYGIELGHVLCRVSKHIGDDAHRLLRWINVGVAHHELLEDVILNGATELFGLEALLFSGYNIKGHDGDDGAIHGHGNRHFIQGNLIEEDLHVLYAIDGDSCFTYVALHPLVIGIITPVGS